MTSSDPDIQKIEDARAQLSHQIQTNRHYESISWQFLRLVLTIIGILLTIASITVSAIVSADWMLALLSEIAEFDPQALAERVAEDIGFAGMFTGGIFTALLLLGLLLLMLVALIDIFVKAPSYAYQIQNPPDIRKGIDLGDETSKLSDLLTEYQEAIDHNKRVVDQTESRWESCLHHLRRGIAIFIIAIFLSIATLVTQSVGLIVLTISALIIYLFQSVKNKFRYDDIITYIRINTLADIGTALLLISYFLFIIYSENIDLSGLTILMMFISCVIIVVGGITSPLDILDRIISRTLFIFFISIVLLFTIFVAQGFTGELPPSEADVVLFAFISLVSVSVSLFFVYFLKSFYEETLPRVKNRYSDHPIMEKATAIVRRLSKRT